MFFPKEMTETEMIVPAKDLLAVTKILSGQGIFHQGESSYQSPDSELNAASGSWQEKAAAFTALERRIQSIMQILGLDEGLPKARDFDTLPDVTEVQPVVDEIEQEVRKINDRLSNENKRLEQLESTLRQLEPVADIDLEVNALRNPHYLYAILGTLPTANIPRLQTSLERIPHVFLTLREDPRKPVVWLAGPKNNSDILERAARSAYLNPMSLPEGYEGTPAEVIKTIHANMEATHQTTEECKRELEKIRESRKSQLINLLWEVRANRLLADAILHYGKLRYTYLIVGWVPTASMPSLTRRLKQASNEILIEAYPIKRAGGNQNVPVALSHSPLLGPFQSLVTTYAQPRYGEIDPTWLLAITFPLLFGAMFGDVGHGLVLAGLGALLSSRRVKALRGMAGLGGLITVCGLVATIFGFLYGSIFGFEEVLHPIWIQPLHNIMQILIVAIVAGIILLSLGFLIGLYNAWISRDWSRFFFDHNGLAGLLLYWSLLGLIGGTFLPNLPLPKTLFVVLAVISGLAVMFSEPLKHLVEGHRPLIEDGIGTYAIQAVVELFETIVSFVSNTLSYIRVGAFAVAHGGLTSVFFILGTMISPGHGVGYWIMVIIGNLFVIGFEGLIVSIQTMRLSYYEFFSKFFTGGGKTYQPLSLQPTRQEE